MLRWLGLGNHSQHVAGATYDADAATTLGNILPGGAAGVFYECGAGVGGGGVICENLCDSDDGE